MKPTTKPKMIRGGRAVAAALAGATLYETFNSGESWQKSRTTAEAFAKQFQHRCDCDHFAVIASDASKVLGPTRTGKAVD